LKSEIPVNLVYEDTLSFAVLRKLLDCSGQKYSIGTTYHARGYGQIYKKIKGFNNAAKGMPYLVLTDLDKYRCSPELIKDWFGAVTIHPNLIFRIAVYEVESWILAGGRTLAHFLGIQESAIPEDTDTIKDPKSFLLTLASKSRKGDLKKDILPRKGSTAKVGPDYNGRMIQYVQNMWDPQEARVHSESLDRMMWVVNTFQPIYERNG